MLALLGATVAVAQDTAPDLQTLVSRMEEAMVRNRMRYRPYVVTREYRLFADDKENPNSQIIAQVSFVPPASKSYWIEKSQGSERGEKIVRKILSKEAQMAGNYGSTAVSRSNYDFQYLGQDVVDGRRCHVLGIYPKRKEEDLLRGRAWVDAETYLIHRIEGKPSKNPSWWLKNVTLTLNFAEVKGMWLQNRTQAVADVRLFGRHMLTSEAMSYQTAETVAANQRSTRPTPSPNTLQRGRPHRPVPRVMLGTGIIRE